MTAAAIGAAPTERKGVPVHARTLFPEDCGSSPILTWKQAADRLWHLTDELAADKRPPGRRRGAEGSWSEGTLRVYTFLIERFRLYDRVFPALATISAATDICANTVQKILKWLRARDWITWVHRAKRTGVKGKGPQVEQCSNQYFLRLPKRVAAKLLGLALKRGRDSVGVHHDERMTFTAAQDLEHGADEAAKLEARREASRRERAARDDHRAAKVAEGRAKTAAARASWEAAQVAQRFDYPPGESVDGRKKRMVAELRAMDQRDVTGRHESPSRVES